MRFRPAEQPRSKGSLLYLLAVLAVHRSIVGGTAVVVVLVKALLEAADALAHALHELGDLLAAEEQQDNNGYNKNFRRTEAAYEHKLNHRLNVYKYLIGEANLYNFPHSEHKVCCFFMPEAIFLSRWP